MHFLNNLSIITQIKKGGKKKNVQGKVYSHLLSISISHYNVADFAVKVLYKYHMKSLNEHELKKSAFIMTMKWPVAIID